jgi:tetrahydromethanopterin S-methyltransferase subunit A
MSDFAFFRFMSGNMLTKEEQEHKDEIIELTEEILHAKGLQCDASIAKISEEQLEEILGKVRELRKKRKKAYGTNIVVVEYDEKDEQKEEIPVVQ